MTSSSHRPALWPALLIALLLCCCCSSPFTFAQAQSVDYTQLVIASISSSGSCQDAFPYAWNCTLPAVLFFTLANAPTSLTSSLYFVIDGNDAETYTYAQRVTASNSTWQGRVQIGGYALGLMGRPLSVTAFDPQSGNRSAAFIGVSFALLPPPILTSISGCQGSGSLTSQCLPGSDSISFSGSGLSIFVGLSSYTLQVGSSSVQLGSSVNAAVVQLVNDSFAILPLADVYASLLTPSQYGGAVLPISFNLQWRQLTQSTVANFYTNQLSISFAPLPPPQATVASSTACPVSNSTALIDCLPGANAGVVALTGAYLVSASASLTAEGRGTWPATVTVSSSTRLWFVLPLIAVDTAGLAWDVRVSTSAGSVTFPGLIRFSTAPYVADVASCSTTGLVLVPSCTPGSTLTLSGDHFLNDSLMQVLITSSSAVSGAVNVSCQSAAFISSNLLTCVVPTLDGSLAQLFYGLTSSLRVLFPSTAQTTNAYTSRLMAWPNSPVLANVSGCETNNGSLALLRCRGGDVISVYGRNLLFYPGANVIPNTVIGQALLPPYGLGRCELLPGGSSELVQCRLPYVDATNSPAQADVQYTVTWYGSTANYSGLLFGNAFYISFTWDPPASTPTPTSSSLSSTMAIVVGVLVPMLVVLVAVAAWLAWRRRRCLKDPSPRSSATTAEQWEEAATPSSSSSWFSRRPDLTSQQERGGLELE